MDIAEVLDTLHLSEQSGHVLSTEEGIILHNSLLLLQNENHFRRIFFWGRIFGIEKDYYLAFGYRSDALSDRTFYYSTNCTDWGLLPQPTEYAKSLAPLCTALFQGDPALVLDVLLEKDEIAFGEPLQQAHVRKLKEEDRLSATIYWINFEACAIPRGGLFKRADGAVVHNLAFEGLDAVEARELKSFLHYREPTQKWNTNLLTRDDYNFAVDFLDPLDIDVPEESWLVNFTASEEMVVLKSLYWPGMFIYHLVKTPRYGFVYFGNGIRSIDAPFFIHGLNPVSDDLFQGK